MAEKIKAYYFSLYCLPSDGTLPLQHLREHIQIDRSDHQGIAKSVLVKTDGLV